MAKAQASSKFGKGAATPRMTRDERIDAAMREAALFAGAQLKRQRLKLPVGKWSDAALVQGQQQRKDSGLAAVARKGRASKVVRVSLAKP